MDNLLVYLPFVFGVVTALFAYYSPQIMTLPPLAKVKAEYPVLNAAIAAAAQMTDRSPYGFLVAAAAQIWTQQGLTQKETATLITASIAYFDKRKYLKTDDRLVSPHDLARGHEIAEIIVSTLPTKPVFRPSIRE